MAQTSWHAVQPYVETRLGRFDMAPLHPCQSAEGARRLAERMVETGTAVGAVALTRTVDLEEGEYADPEVLAAFGRVPAEESDLPW